MINQRKSKLTKEESGLLTSFEADEWRSVKNTKAEKLKAKNMAADTLKKDARINIRLSSNDLQRLKNIANQEGLPYQTLIASILHKFAAGRLKNAA